MKFRINVHHSNQAHEEDGKHQLNAFACTAQDPSADTELDDALLSQTSRATPHEFMQTLAGKVPQQSALAKEAETYMSKVNTALQMLCDDSENGRRLP